MFSMCEYFVFGRYNFINHRGEKMKSIIVSMVAVASLVVAGSASAGAFSIAPCKACHAVGKDTVGPDLKVVAEQYGDAKKLAEVFKSGFAVEARKVAASSEKWKKQAALMTGQYTTLIKGHEDEAAEAIFAAVKAGKL
jgi:cytochrome c551/c552